MNLFEQIKPGDIVIDCGAYLGRITNYFADRGAIVHSFEPCFDLYNRLLVRFATYNNVLVWNRGVWDNNCDLDLFFHKDYEINKDGIYKFKYLESSSVFKSKRNVGGYSEVFKMINLSEFIFQLNGRVKLLKLNIEGSEYRVIKDLIRSKAVNKIDNIVVSWHKRKIPTLESAHRRLKAKVQRENLFNTVVKWKWWNNNKGFLMKINKEYS
jgi:FkbM family methyltransferase